jgi:hypothetical protein
MQGRPGFQACPTLNSLFQLGSLRKEKLFSIDLILGLADSSRPVMLQTAMGFEAGALRVSCGG